MKKSTIIKSLVIAFSAIALVTALSISTIQADSLYDEYGITLEVTEGQIYTVEEMLDIALKSEYLALAEYEAIIETFGEVRPFTHIVKAEAVHAQSLLTLYDTYGYTVINNSASEQVVIPESISQAISTAIESEEATIALYTHFLAQDNLPEDVRDTFEYLLQASENHLRAFQKDRTYGYAKDFASNVKNMFQNRQGQGQSNNRGAGQRSQTSVGLNNCNLG